MAEWITTKKAGQLLGVNIRTIQRYIEKGKLKAKVVSGKNSIKKDAVLKLKPEEQTTETKIQENEIKPRVQSDEHWQIPEGYLLIDKSTLDSLRDQINKLTDSVSEMQLTQKLLIEKGLNLKESQENILAQPETVSSDPTTLESTIIDTPIANVAKAHEEFFGKKKSSYLNLLWIIPLVIIGLLFVFVLINFLATGSF